MKTKELKEFYDFLKKTLPCEKIIITGTIALTILGLWDKGFNDLDFILIKPTEETLNVLKKLKVNMEKSEYLDSNYHKIKIPNFKTIDIFVSNTDDVSVIELADGILVAAPFHVVKQKQSYKRGKDLVQLKYISEKFYDEVFQKQVLDNEIHKLNNNQKLTV